MNESQYRLFLSGGAFVCAAGALLNLARVGSRGASAWLLSGAFLALGGLLWMIRIGAADGLRVGAGALIVVLLVADVVVRARKQGP